MQAWWEENSWKKTLKTLLFKDFWLVVGVYTVHSESIKTPSLFSVMLCCSLILQLFKFIVFLINLHSIPHNDKWKQYFRNVCTFIKKKKLKYHIYISIQTLCNNTCKGSEYLCISALKPQMPPISLTHCWDILFLHIAWSPPVVN